MDKATERDLVLQFKCAKEKRDALKEGMKQAQEDFQRTQQKQRIFGEVSYAAATWDKPRRVIVKAEHTEGGENPRFVPVTPLPDWTNASQGVRALGADLAGHVIRVWLAAGDLQAKGVFVSRGPLFGVGGWGYRQFVQINEYVTPQEIETMRAGKGMANVHNDVLQFLAEHGFVGFGFRDTGLSFTPRLSNVHVWRLGGSFRPFTDVEALKDLELGSDWFLYAKNRARAAISDPTADNYSGYVGWEMDYFINWRLSSDLSWTIRWGTFCPGSAYQDQHTRHFLLTGVTWSF